MQTLNNNKRNLAITIIVILAIALAVGGYYWYGSNDETDEQADIQTEEQMDNYGDKMMQEDSADNMEDASDDVADEAEENMDDTMNSARDSAMDDVMDADDQGEDEDNTEDELVVEEPAAQMIVTASQSAYAFPAGAATSFDAAGDLTGGAFVEASNNNASFLGRDLYVLQKINETIGMEVDENAAAVVFPASLRFATDHDGVENVTGWECGGAYMSDRDSYLLYALTEVRRGNDASSVGFGFFGNLLAESDSTGDFTSGLCEDVEGVKLEARDRYLLSVINSLVVSEQ